MNISNDGKRALEVLFGVVLTWAALKASIGTIVTPMRGNIRPKFGRRDVPLTDLGDLPNLTARQRWQAKARRLNYRDLV